MNECNGLFIVDYLNWVYKFFIKYVFVEELLVVFEIGVIEIYIGMIECFEGDLSSVDVWDWMLIKGCVVYGYVMDD